MKPKFRLDQILVDRNLVDSRSKAQALILRGDVLINDVPEKAAGKKFSEDVKIRIRGVDPYVSRSAYKLKQAFERGCFEVKDKTVLDVGASTGGFTQVCLEYGANLVYALDVGHSQLHSSLVLNEKVISMEKTNIREWSRPDGPIHRLVVDVSFISVTKFLPNLWNQFEAIEGDFLSAVLIKPQFEANREDIQKGGLIEKERGLKVANKVVDVLKSKSELLDFFECTLKGKDGNQEYMSIWKMNKN